jgi:hypothetical protein
MSNKGLDIGTNMLVAGMLGEDGSPVFKMERDAFYTITPKSEVNKNSIRTSLEKRGANFIIDEKADSFIVVGNSALEIAIERNDVAKRPLQRGIISPREKSSLPMLKLIIKSLIGEGQAGDKVIYSVPAKPIDATFNIIYHTEIMNKYLTEMGYNAQPINEGFAIAISELLDEGLTGLCLSYGAGMTNISVIHEGDPLIEFSVTRSGDFIDQSVGEALDISPSLVQMEKEAGIDLDNPSNQITEAVSVYYSSVINYTLSNIVYELEARKKQLPAFREPVPIIVSGGLSLAKGFVKRIESSLRTMNFPLKIKEIRRAENPLTAVARGCLLASQL